MQVNSRIKLMGGNVITPYRQLTADIYIEDGIIQSIQGIPADWEPNSFEVVDVRGKVVLPGLIDLHTHGAGGADFMDATEDAFYTAGRIHLHYGTTTLLPTTVTTTLDSLLDVISTFRELPLFPDAADFFGLHIEGPYFSETQKGAQDGTFIRNPDSSEYMKVLEHADSIARWSFAPEIEGGYEFADVLRKHHILASAAHSDASYEEMMEALEHGVDFLTHFYSGMSTVTRKNAYRIAGMIESGYLMDDFNLEVISDGSHLPASLLKLIVKVKAKSSICLISDSLRAAGLGEGVFAMGKKEYGRKILVEDHVAKLPDRSAFAGSVTLGIDLVRNMMNLSGISLEEAVRMMTVNPAKVLGIQNQKGSIAPGLRADIVVADPELSIDSVFKAGELVYARS